MSDLDRILLSQAVIMTALATSTSMTDQAKNDLVLCLLDILSNNPRVQHEFITMFSRGLPESVTDVLKANKGE